MALAPLGSYFALARFAEIDNASQTEQGTQAPLTLVLTSAQQVNLLEQCLPLFKDAAPRHDIAAQIAALCRPAAQAGKHVHSLRVQAFDALTRLAAPAHRALFQLEVGKTVVRSANGVLSEQLGYRFSIDQMLVAADIIDAEQQTPMLRFLREIDRAELPVTGEGRAHIDGPSGDNTALSRQFIDAHLLNRLVDALPDDKRWRASATLDTLALKIDQINTHANCEHQQHVALGEKVAVLAEALPEHTFALKFATRFSFDGGHYAVVLQPAAEAEASSSTVPVDHVLYEAWVSLWENDQYAPMIVSAMQRHVRSACTELQPLLDLAADPVLPTLGVPTNASANANANASASANASTKASASANANPNPNPNSNAATDSADVVSASPHASAQTKPPKSPDKIDINIILKNALSALRDDYLSNLPGALNPDALLALHRSVGAIAVGNTTIGALWELDKQVFDIAAEQASFGLSSPLLPDPQRFV